MYSPQPQRFRIDGGIKCTRGAAAGLVTLPLQPPPLFLSCWRELPPIDMRFLLPVCSPARPWP